jgi:MFS family permease
MRLPFRTSSLEEGEDAVLQGDRPLQPGSARAALAVRDFRIVFVGSFASNIGTWMQNVTLGAFAYELTRSPAFVSLIVFAQLGPMLLLSVVGGLLADTFERGRIIVTAQAVQLLGALALAALVVGDDPPRPALFGCVLLIGIGNALNAPAWVAAMPDLVGKENLAGAISLNSTQMNASRVIGPALGGALYPAIGAAGVFLVNALTYTAAIATVLAVTIPPVVQAQVGPQGWRRLAGGFAVAKRDPLVGRILLVLVTYSFFCLPFIGQMPTVASVNLGMDTESLAYGLLYACFGLGAVTGAMSIGTFLVSVDKDRIVRLGFAGFSVALLAFALLRSPGPAYPVIALVGFTYFGAMTALNTVLQSHLPEGVRGRVMSLWLMGFGGTIPLGLLFAGPIAEATSITVVLLYGAAISFLLFLVADLPGARARGEALVAAVKPERPCA